MNFNLKLRVPVLVISDKILQLQHDSEALKLVDQAVSDSGETRCCDWLRVLCRRKETEWDCDSRDRCLSFPMKLFSFSMEP